MNVRIEKHPEEIIEVDPKIIESVKARLSEKKVEKETFYNTLEDCVDYKE